MGAVNMLLLVCFGLFISVRGHHFPTCVHLLAVDCFLAVGFKFSRWNSDAFLDENVTDGRADAGGGKLLKASRPP